MHQEKSLYSPGTRKETHPNVLKDPKYISLSGNTRLSLGGFDFDSVKCLPGDKRSSTIYLVRFVCLRQLELKDGKQEFPRWAILLQIQRATNFVGELHEWVKSADNGPFETYPMAHEAQTHIKLQPGADDVVSEPLATFKGNYLDNVRYHLHSIPRPTRQDLGNPQNFISYFYEGLPDVKGAVLEENGWKVWKELKEKHFQTSALWLKHVVNYEKLSRELKPILWVRGLACSPFLSSPPLPRQGLIQSGEIDVVTV